MASAGNPLNTLMKLSSSRGPLALFFGAAALALGAINSVYSVEGGHRSVVFNRVVGVKNKVYGEGMHFMIPWFDRPEIFSIRTKVHRITGDTPSKDLQIITITLRVLMKPQPQNLPNILRHLGRDYDDRVIKSVGPEVLKSTVAQFNASELVTQREMVSQLIRKRLSERVQDFWIDLEDVSIVELTFGQEYLAAVEAKQVAQQDAERAKFIVERAKQSKLEIIVKAEGEAKAAKLFNEQLEQDKKGTFLELRRIEAAKEIARILSASNNRIFLNSDNLMFNQITSGRSTINELIDLKPVKQ
jgi:prohibitin 2